MLIVYEHSVDFGKVWTKINPQPGCPLLSYLLPLKALEIFDDGLGNLYRWREES